MSVLSMLRPGRTDFKLQHWAYGPGSLPGRRPAAMSCLSQLSAAFQAPQDNKSTVLLALAGGASAIAALGYLATRSSKGYKRKPSSFEISGGAVDAEKVKDTVRA